MRATSFPVGGRRLTIRSDGPVKFTDGGPIAAPIAEGDPYEGEHGGKVFAEFVRSAKRSAQPDRSLVIIQRKFVLFADQVGCAPQNEGDRVLGVFIDVKRQMHQGLLEVLLFDVETGKLDVGLSSQ